MRGLVGFSVAGRLAGQAYLMSNKIHTQTLLRLHMPHRMDSQGCGLHLWEISRPSGGVLRRHHGRTVCRASLRAETRKQGLAIDSRKSSCDPLCDSGRAGGRCLVAQSLLLSCCGSDDGVCRDAGAVRGWPEAGVVGDSLWRYLDSCLRWRLLFSGGIAPQT